MRPLLFAVFMIPFTLASIASVNGQETSSAAGATKPYVLISQPEAAHTDRARSRGIEGSVRLKITLLATGQVGDVTVVKTKGWKKMAKFGLTERGASAAKQVEFEPKFVNGAAVSVVITAEYQFTIY